MIVISMQLATIPTVVLHARAILDTQAMERFVKVWSYSMLDHKFNIFLKFFKNVL